MDNQPDLQSDEAELTPEEEAQFNVLNASAFDLHRRNCRVEEIIPPCWLCMSEEAREEQRQKVRAYVAQFPLFNWSYAESDPVVLDKVAAWRRAEAVFKKLRQEGNPRAFFVGG